MPQLLHSRDEKPQRPPKLTLAASPSRARSLIRLRSIAATMNSIFSAMLAALGRYRPRADPGPDVQVDVLGLHGLDLR
jgi:hypothetical protein